MVDTPNHLPRGTPTVARTPYYDSDNPSTVVRGASWRIGVWVIAVVAFFGLLGAGIWAFQVSTSDVKGKGDAVRTVNRGDNRLAQQAYFEQTWADIKAADAKLDQLAADKVAKVDGADIRYSGAVTYCIQLRGDYNAAARKQIAAKFKDASLPDQIDPTAPETDCKETAR
jgi:hypothetical protein